MNRFTWNEFSTTALPGSERLSAIREELIRRQAALDAARPDMQISGMVKRCRLGMVDMALIATAAASHVRMPELAGDGDAVLALICRDGGLLCSRGDEAVRIGPGEGIICDSLEPGGLQMESRTRCWALKVARADMAKAAPQARRFNGLKLNAAGMAAKLLTRYLDGLQDAEVAADKREARVFGEHLLDLIGMAIDGEEETRQLAERRGVRAVRHAAVLREIERNIGDSRLSAAVVAERLGVTPRYVHFLLEESGRTFSEHVLARRLKLVEELLGDAEKGNLKISAIARQAGFTDMSYFNRCFRNLFGDTPTGFRKRAHTARPAHRSDIAILKCA